MTPLHPLRIPAGWQVMQNHFLQITPAEAMLESGRLDFPFVEDILQMRNDHLRMVLDLGWYPEGDPQGSYGLVLIQANPPIQHAEMPPHTVTKQRGGITYMYALQADFSGDPWKHPLVEFNSQDATEIVRQIDEVLAKADSGELGRP